MSPWIDYREQAHPTHTTVGKLRLLHNVWSPQLENHRDLLVYLPPSHGQVEKRFPVVYMHDGQNLFDRMTGFAGHEWEVDETMEALERILRLEAIVVGIANAGESRSDEYSPFKDTEYGGGQGDAYLRFIVETVKPLIDADFQTLPERASTGILGSSMGGLISLYAFFRYPETFGFVGSLSPAFWFADKAIFSYITTAPFNPGKIYLDSGTAERSSEAPDPKLRGLARCFCEDSRMMRDILLSKGYHEDYDLIYIQEQNGQHSEAVWARRLPFALRFLLPDQQSAV